MFPTRLTQHLPARSFARAAAALAAATLLAQAAPARADTTPEPQGVVTLTGSASVQVPKDWMSVTFSTTREGADAAGVQAALKQALDAALKQAQAAKRPDGQVEVHTGAFSLQPRYSSKGQMNGWTGTTELRVEGRDMAAIADLAGRVSTLSIERLDYAISREARAKVESDVAGQAIAAFRAKAGDYAKAFGYGGYAVREVNVQTDAAEPPRPRVFAAMAKVADAPAPLPVDPGSGTVTATVSGSVQMR